MVSGLTHPAVSIQSCNDNCKAQARKTTVHHSLRIPSQRVESAEQTHFGTGQLNSLPGDIRPAVTKGVIGVIEKFIKDMPVKERFSSHYIHCLVL